MTTAGPLKQPAEPAPSLHPSSFILHSFPFAGALVSYVWRDDLRRRAGRCPLVAPGRRFATGCPRRRFDATASWKLNRSICRRHRSGRLPVLDIAPTAGPVIVGKITGMSNCQWAHPPCGGRKGDLVPLGRKYPITAGLLEIT